MSAEFAKVLVVSTAHLGAAIATGGAEQMALTAAWGEFMQVVVQHGDAIAALMDLDPLALIASNSAPPGARK